MTTDRPASEASADVAGTMSIGEMSRAFDVSQRALRFYEDRGLLSPRRDGSSRLYGAEERRRLETILRGKRLGFTLTEIMRLLAPGASDGAMLDLDRRQIDAQIAHLERQRAGIEAALAELRAARAARAGPES